MDLPGFFFGHGPLAGVISVLAVIATLSLLYIWFFDRPKSKTRRGNLKWYLVASAGLLWVCLVVLVSAR